MFPIYFENCFAIRRKIGEAETMDNVHEIINKFLEDHKYKSYYRRFTDLGSEYQIDVGSHSEFFYVSNDIKE